MREPTETPQAHERFAALLHSCGAGQLAGLISAHAAETVAARGGRPWPDPDGYSVPDPRPLQDRTPYILTELVARGIDFADAVTLVRDLADAHDARQAGAADGQERVRQALTSLQQALGAPAHP
ncbi:hypothetical protein [Streptomyces sp. CB03238]|uniref:hypothetical protein n=1 Tax=Streptomyces sp. CB03238 TaxID=1907777 RepID=UPI000A11FF4D|nr:hypothetical protein [Streptomyces sp. CB03238]ORT54638.1 hypothetical protein BKD26_34670 [Streptomyces sp. CB03238]